MDTTAAPRRRVVGIASSALTLVVDALMPGYHPARDPAPELAGQRLAVIRSYLYGGVQFWVTPTVRAEYERMQTDPSKRLGHERAAWILLADVELRADPAAVSARAAELQRVHQDLDECRIVSEVEHAGLSALVTYDKALIVNLGRRARVNLTWPSAFWHSLGIRAGAEPCLDPPPSHPLAQQTWWRLGAARDVPRRPRTHGD